MCEGKEVAEFFKCRNIFCHRPAKDGYACCSDVCRRIVPNCSVKNCHNAVEGPGIYKGMVNVEVSYSKNCYRHGGRIEYDGEPQMNLKRVKVKWFHIKNIDQWAQVNHSDTGITSIEKS